MDTLDTQLAAAADIQYHWYQSIVRPVPCAAPYCEKKHLTTGWVRASDGQALCEEHYHEHRV